MEPTNKRRLPASPSNPSQANTIQMGCKRGKHDEMSYIPPAWVTFGDANSTTSSGANKIPVGYNKGTVDRTVIGVSIDGIIDPESAQKFPESAGRYAVAVQGKVIVAAHLDSMNNQAGKFLYVSNTDVSTYWVEYRGKEIFLPKFEARVSDDADYTKIGLITYVNQNYTNDHIAEVEVQLQLY